MGLRYVIVGTGAVGGYYGAMLKRGGADVTFVLRSDYEYVKKHGLSIRAKHGDFVLPKVRARSNITVDGPFDVAVIAVKECSNSIYREVARNLTGKGIALVLQNGLRPEQPAIDVLGNEYVAGGACYICCNKLGPGLIQHVDYGKIVMGSYDGSLHMRTILQYIQKDFERAGVPAEFTADLRLARWKKLVWNIPYNGLSVLFDRSTDQLMADPRTRGLVARMMTEVIESARADGSTIPASYATELLDFTDKMAPYETSMQLDYRAGRPMEIEPIFIQALNAAQKGGYTPELIAALCDALKKLESRTVPREEIQLQFESALCRSNSRTA